MKEHPRLLNADMVRATLDGPKTQTRTVATKDSSTTTIYWVKNAPVFPDGEPYTGWVKECGASLLIPIKCPFGKPGDRLWVRETFAQGKWDEMHTAEGETPESYIAQSGDDKETDIVYRADTLAERNYCEDSLEPVKWCPSIFMPKSASRISLLVKKIWVERVQEISHKDRLAEGYAQFYGQGPYNTYAASDTALWWNELWDSIYATPRPVNKTIEGKRTTVSYVSYPWENIQTTGEYRGLPWVVNGNPWLFVCEFERIINA